LGLTTVTQNHGFDFYTGQATKVQTTDSYGGRFMAVTDQAYKHYPGMGLKIYNPRNKHMLTQEAASYLYKLDPVDGSYAGVVSASITTWSDQTKILDLNLPQSSVWRLQSTYQWNGEQNLRSDGTYPYSDFALHPFDRNDLALNSAWEKTSEVTLYDVYSKGLEGRDINGNYASSRLDKDHTRVIASAVNARYNEIASSSAEFYSGNTEPEGGVARGDGSPSRAHVHTGKFSLLVGSGGKGFNYTLSAKETDLTKKYRASVWVYAPGESETQADLNKLELYYIINGREMGSVHPVLQKNKAKSWYLLNLDVTPDGSNEIFIGVRNGTQRGVYFDDFRVHPLNASLMSYVYDDLTGELIYILDVNNFYTRFEYDEAGRLVRTTRELLNFDFGDGKESFRADALLNEVKYNYGKGNE
jgi:YD repeat-containing protein